MQDIDVVVIGAGAAGLMCAIQAASRGRSVVILEKANKPGKKILMSGGGRCNFTNYHISPECYISHNPHFCKSALRQYTQWDFIDLVKKYGIAFHEKSLGQLFCNDKSKAIVDMLLAECDKFGVQLLLAVDIVQVRKQDEKFTISTNKNIFSAQSLVVASGGLSIPTMGASPFGYQLAEQFGINVWPTRAGLVPFTLHPEDKEIYSSLSGISVNAQLSNHRKSFRENILFTHRGISGPAALQISSYWLPGEEINIRLLPDVDMNELLKQQRKFNKQLKTILSDYLAKRLVQQFIPDEYAESKMLNLSNKAIQEVCDRINNWQLKPNGTEGYRTAEVTLGGVDCDAVSSKTMEARNVPGLYFIGEVLDVTGWLGGYNFQWAWSSGWVAGQAV